MINVTGYLVLLTTPTTTQFAFQNPGNVIYISKASSRGSPYSPMLAPEDAGNLDTKMDDGLPGTGSVISNKGDGTTTYCTSVAGTTTDAGATYNFNVTNKDCYLQYLRAF